VASLLGEGEAWNAPDTLGWRIKRCRDAPRGWGRNVGTVRRGKRGDLSAEVTAGRSQSPHGTEVAAGHSRSLRWERRAERGARSLTGGELGADGRPWHDNHGGGTGGREVEA